MRGIKILFIIQYIAYRIWIKAFFHYSGLAFIAAKFSSNKNEDEHPTLFIWLLSIYIAAYGLASQRYERDITRYQDKINLYGAFVASGNNKKGIWLLSKLRFESLIIEPSLYSPTSVYRAFVGDKEPLNKEQLRFLSDVILDLLYGYACDRDKIKESISIYYQKKGFSEILIKDPRFGMPNFVLWVLDLLKTPEDYEELIFSLDYQSVAHVGKLLFHDCPVLNVDYFSYDIDLINRYPVNIHNIKHPSKTFSFNTTFFSHFEGWERDEIDSPLYIALKYQNNTSYFGSLNLSGKAPIFQNNKLIFTNIKRELDSNSSPISNHLQDSKTYISQWNWFFFSRMRGYRPTCEELYLSPPWNIHDIECKETEGEKREVKGYSSYKQMIPIYLDALKRENPEYAEIIDKVSTRLNIEMN